MFAGELATCWVMSVGSERSRVNDANGWCRLLSSRSETWKRARQIRVLRWRDLASRCGGQGTKRRLANRWLGFGMERGHEEPTLRVERRAGVKRWQQSRNSTHGFAEEEKKRLHPAMQTGSPRRFSSLAVVIRRV